MSAGWIKLHRSLREHPVWTEGCFDLGKAFVDLLLAANYKDRYSIRCGFDVKRGQVLTSHVALAHRWKRNRKTVAAYLLRLKKAQMVDTQSSNRTDTGYTLITVRNYDVYQSSDDPEYPSTETSEGTSSTHRVPIRRDIDYPPTNKERSKEGKKGRKTPLDRSLQNIKETLEEERND